MGQGHRVKKSERFLWNKCSKWLLLGCDQCLEFKKKEKKEKERKKRERREREREKEREKEDKNVSGIEENNEQLYGVRMRDNVGSNWP